MPFGRDGAFRVRDSGIAEEIKTKYGGDVVVSKIRYPDVHDRGHRYFFGMIPEMPWKRKKGDGEHGTEEVEEMDSVDAEKAWTEASEDAQGCVAQSAGRT